MVGLGGGCFDFRLDYSDRHWQSWDYCVRSGSLESPSRAGYYDWDFVAFDVDDTSTFRCSPAIVTIPVDIVRGAREVVACTGSNNHLAVAPVSMRGASTVVGPTSVKVAGQAVATVQVNERVTFSGGQSGFNTATTWSPPLPVSRCAGPGTPSSPRRHRSGTRHSTHMATSR